MKGKLSAFGSNELLDKDVHAVIWGTEAADSVPKKLISVIRSLRNSVAKSFNKESQPLI